MAFDKTKYITFEDAGLEQMVIFGNLMQHRDVAHMMGVEDKIISAGFISVGHNREGDVVAQAYGRSISLSVDSRKEDDKLAMRLLGLDDF